MASRSHIAAIRFGLGAGPTAAVPPDPLPGLLGQLRPLPAARGPDAQECFAAARAAPPGELEAVIARRTALIRQEIFAATGRALTTDTPYAERLVRFWTNHFAVSRRSGVPANVLAGLHEREAIRPHALGRFEDMLLAAIRSPAMIGYLDNASSAGPNSRFGLRTGRGLVENLAREVLELHTVTPAAGYTQQDVVQLARLLSGWSLGRGAAHNEPDGFLFRPNAHEPGPKTLLGQSFPEGQEGAEQALRFLARHPATQRHLGVKLARHFIADEPPPAAVRRIAGTLEGTGGDLGAVARLLVEMPEAWAQPLGKLRAPQDYAIAVLRALGAGAEAAVLLHQAMEHLGQPLWAPPSPAGWPDTAAEWATPEQLMRRLDWAHAHAGRAAAAGRDAREAAEATLGPLLGAEAAQAVRRAGSAREALLFLLASPEFQRR